MIQVYALGGFRVLRDGADVKALAGQPMRGALVTYLAIEREVTRDSLLAVFWPESRDATARHALRQALLNLRRELGPDWIGAAPLNLSMTDRLKTDVDAFLAALAESDWCGAAEHYSGPFLAGVHLHRGHAWQAWVTARRLDYARAFRTACRNWVDDTVAVGNAAAAIGAARLWVERDPTDDEAQHRLIELLAGAGERTEALRQFEVYAQLLRVDGLDPLDETLALYDALRDSPQKPRRPEPPHDTDADSSLSQVPLHARNSDEWSSTAFPGPPSVADSSPIASHWTRFRFGRRSGIVAFGALIFIGVFLATRGDSGRVANGRMAVLPFILLMNPAAEHIGEALVADLEFSVGTFSPVIEGEFVRASWSSLVPPGGLDAGEHRRRIAARLKPLGADQWIDGSITQAGDSIDVRVFLHNLNSVANVIGLTAPLPEDRKERRALADSLAHRLFAREVRARARLMELLLQDRSH